jgi:hypothetical protein
MQVLTADRVTLTRQHGGQLQNSAGPYYSLGNIGTVPRAYDTFRAYEGMEGRENKVIIKYENLGLIQNTKLKFKNTFKKKNYTLSLPVKWGVHEKSTFLSLCLAKGTIGV